MSLRIVVGTIAALVAIFLVVPLLVMVPTSFTPGNSLAFPPPGFSLRWYQTVFSDRAWIDSILLSLRVSALSAVLASLLGITASIALVRSNLPAKPAIYAALLTPVVVPTIVIAVAQFFVFAPLHMVGSWIAITLGITIVAIPLVIIVATATLDRFDQRLEQAALSLGADPLRAFVFVTMPLIAPGLLSGLLFAFTNSFQELMIPLLLSSPSTMTLSVRIWTNVVMDIQPSIAAVSTFLLFGTLVLVLIINLLQSIARKESHA